MTTALSSLPPARAWGARPPARLAALATALALASALPAQAQPQDDRAELERLRATTSALIDALVNQGLLTRERADAIVRQAASSAAPAATAAAQWGSPARPAGSGAAPAGNVIRVPYVSDTLRAQLRDEIKNEVLATAREERWADPRQIPEWVQGLQIDGDVRLRWQSERYPQALYQRDDKGNLIGDACTIVGGNLPARCYKRQVGSPGWSPDLSNTTTDRDRLTLRARLGVSAKVSDDTSVALRLSTGSTSGPTSSSQTLGQSFNKASLVIDRAAVRWEPRQGLRLTGGRMANPFFSSDLSWPDDLSFDGVAVQGDMNLASGAYAFATAGAFPLEEFNLSGRDKWLYGVQAGVDWAFGNGSSLRVGAALYDFSGVAGVREAEPAPTGERAGTEAYQTSQYPASLRLKGNTLINLNDPSSTAAPVWGLASRFRPLNLTAQLTLKQFEGVDIGVGVDWINNTGFKLDDIRRRARTDAVDSLAKMTHGLQTRLSVGTPRLSARGDWLVFGTWRKFERDAWIDGFTDTTWHVGGTGYQGFQLGGQYAFDRRTTLGLRLTSTRNLDDGVRVVNATTGAIDATLSSAPLKVEVIQLDLSTRF